MKSNSLIVLFTDFGLPYTGQMKGVLRREAPEVDIIDLFNDAPAHDPMAAAYLLPAYADDFPEETVFLCVVDPGVGGTRGAGVLRAGGRWYVGPDNGLFEMIVRRAPDSPRWWDIDWRPEGLSCTFHGRDLFAPVAAMLARGEPPQGRARPVDDIRRPDWPDDLAQIIYVDGFGNMITGIRAKVLRETDGIVAGDRRLERARTFSDVSPGAAFWYENANGLVEISVNQARASTVLGLAMGSEVTMVSAP